MNATRGLRASTIAAVLALTPASVFAADLAVRRGPPPPQQQFMPPPIYSWTGFFIGGNLGGVWETARLTDFDLGPIDSASRSGFIGGGQIGYNWQFAPWAVIGVEWMFDGTSLNTNGSGVDAFGEPVLASTKVDWVSTLTGRLGYAANNWLFYGKGGVGWVHDSASAVDVVTGDAFNVSQTSTGWAAGGGIEYGFSHNWTFRLDYTHIGLDDQSFPGFGLPPDTATLSRHFDIVTVGANYKF